MDEHRTRQNEVKTVKNVKKKKAVIGQRIKGCDTLIIDAAEKLIAPMKEENREIKYILRPRRNVYWSWIRWKDKDA